MIEGCKLLRSPDAFEVLQVFLRVFQQVSEIISGLDWAVIGIRAVEDRDEKPHSALHKPGEGHPGIGDIPERSVRMMANQVIEKINVAVDGGPCVVLWLTTHGLSLRRNYNSIIVSVFDKTLSLAEPFRQNRSIWSPASIPSQPMGTNFEARKLKANREG